MFWKAYSWSPGGLSPLRHDQRPGNDSSALFKVVCNPTLSYNPHSSLAGRCDYPCLLQMKTGLQRSWVTCQERRGGEERRSRGVWPAPHGYSQFLNNQVWAEGLPAIAPEQELRPASAGSKERQHPLPSPPLSFSLQSSFFVKCFFFLDYMLISCQFKDIFGKKETKMHWEKLKLPFPIQSLEYQC